MRPTTIITRPHAAGERLARQLGDLVGADCAIIQSPVIEIIAVPADVVESRHRAVVFTSVHGVAHAPTNIAPLPCWCVGEKTASAAREAGFDVKHIAQDGETLLADIINAEIAGPLLHLRGKYARVDIASRLTDAAIPCDDRVVYAQEPCALTQGAHAVLGGETPVILPLYSPRSAALVADQGPFAAPITVVAISAAVASEAARMDPASVILADRPDGSAMLKAIVDAAGTVCPK